MRSPELYVFPHCACAVCDGIRHTAAHIDELKANHTVKQSSTALGYSQANATVLFIYTTQAFVS